MPKKSSLAVAVQRVATSVTVPAPVGGLNARDSLALMKPEQAVVLENFFPLEYGVKVRRGWATWATGLGGTVQSLIKWVGTAGIEKLFGCASGSIYDVTDSGPVGAAVAVGFNSDYFQFIQTANITGTYTVACNDSGLDNPVKYNGTTWTQAIIVADPVIYPSFDATKLISVGLQHRRLFFIEKDSTRAWYLGVDEVQGDAKEFDLGEVFPHGGHLQSIMYWSADTGQGMESLNVFISSMGDVAVFTGYDVDQPNDGSAADPTAPYKLSAVYKTGRTLGLRCAVKYGSDVGILSENGFVLLSQLLAQSRMLMQPPMSDIIQQLLSTDITKFADLKGWQIMPISRYQQVLLNVPDPDGPYRQYCMNDVTEAWCTFKGYHGFCWGSVYEEPYFGSTGGVVGRAWYGNLDTFDLDTLIGYSIQTRGLQAFNYMGNKTVEQKVFSMVRPIFNAGDAPDIAAALNMDFAIFDNLAYVPTSSSGVHSALWNDARWDDPAALWSAGQRSFADWIDVTGVGFCAGITIKTATRNETFWVATDVLYQVGNGVF